MAKNEDQPPESQIGRAQWLADELALCGHEEITTIDILDALAIVGLKLMPDMKGASSHEYMSAHKSVICNYLTLNIRNRPAITGRSARATTGG
ncbi:hypothetical protein IV102_35600 [bacterium]|nr:hypothetical protein [bacterium]